jgi:hypothetical protein
LNRDYGLSVCAGETQVLVSTRILLVQKGNRMRIAVLPVFRTRVAAATSGVGRAPVVAAQTLIIAGQRTSAAIHPTPPASGCTRALRDFDARLSHLVGDNTSGVSRGSGRAASAAGDRKAPPVNQRPSAISAVVLPSPATSFPSPSTGVRETVATCVPTGNGKLRLLSSN